jgi:hypothetical protein
VLNPEVYERIEVAVADVVPVALALASANDSMAGGAPAGWQQLGDFHGNAWVNLESTATMRKTRPGRPESFVR